MRRFLFSVSVSLVTCIMASASAQAACYYTPAGDHICNGGAPASPVPPPTPPGPPIATTPPPPPYVPGEPVDYSKFPPDMQAHVQPNLTQEIVPLAAGTCADRTIAPGSTTSIPFVYDGTTPAMNISPGGSETRVFISQMPGFDPLNTLAPGAESDFNSPCHARANIPEICVDSCTPDLFNENTLTMMDSAAVSADPAANYMNCPLVPGQTYFLNIQNEGTTPTCANVGYGTTCASCAPMDGGGGH